MVKKFLGVFLLIYLIYDNNYSATCSTHSDLQHDAKCLYMPEGTSADLNVGNNYEIEFFLPFKWFSPDTTEFLRVTLFGSSHLSVVLKPREASQDDLEADVKLINLDAAHWKPGWNALTVSAISVNGSYGYVFINKQNETRLNMLNLEIFYSSMKVQGMFSLIDCKSGSRIYTISKLGLMLPLEIHSGQISEIKIRGLGGNYLVAIRRRREKAILCPNETALPFEICDDGFEFKRDIFYTYKGQSLITESEILHNCQGYTQAKLSIYGLNDVNFTVTMQIQNQAYNCTQTITNEKKDSHVAYRSTCNNIWITCIAGVFTLAIAVLALYFHLTSPVAKTNDHAAEVRWKNLKMEFAENIGDEAALTRQNEAKEDYYEYEITNSNYVAFEDRNNSQGDEAALTRQNEAKEDYYEYEITNSNYVAFEDRNNSQVMSEPRGTVCEDQDLDEYESPENDYDIKNENI